MKYLTLILAMFLTACNGSSDDDSLLATKAQLPPNESTQVAALRAEISALQASVSKLQLIGKVHGVTTDSVGRVVDAVGNPVSFGPCADMGVLIGFTGTSSNFVSDPLYAKYQAFKQCTGYSYEVDNFGKLAPVQRLYWDGPNCTGNMWEWNASGTSFNDQTLTSGVAFINPADSITQLMVKAGQTPQIVQAASVYIISNGDCEPDGDQQPMYAVSNNDIQVTGIPGSIGTYSLVSP